MAASDPHVHRALCAKTAAKLTYESSLNDLFDHLAMPRNRFHVLQRRVVKVLNGHLGADVAHQASRLLILKVHLHGTLLCLRSAA